LVHPKEQLLLDNVYNDGNDYQVMVLPCRRG